MANVQDLIKRAMAGDEKIIAMLQEKIDIAEKVEREQAERERVAAVEIKRQEWINTSTELRNKIAEAITADYAALTTTGTPVEGPLKDGEIRQNVIVATDLPIHMKLSGNSVQLPTAQHGYTIEEWGNLSNIVTNLFAFGKDVPDNIQLVIGTGAAMGVPAVSVAGVGREIAKDGNPTAVTKKSLFSKPAEGNSIWVKRATDKAYTRMASRSVKKLAEYLYGEGKPETLTNAGGNVTKWMALPGNMVVVQPDALNAPTV